MDTLLGNTDSEVDKKKKGNSKHQGSFIATSFEKLNRLRESSLFLYLIRQP